MKALIAQDRGLTVASVSYRRDAALEPSPGGSGPVNVLSFQSTVTHGRVGHRAAVFALERLGHDVWPIDTVAFSNHPAHGSFRGRVRPAAEAAELLAGLVERGVLAQCDAVLSGYLGEAATGGVVEDAVERVRRANPVALYWCDPVIGEVGRGVYVRPGVAEWVRDRLLPLADVVTPNAFELELLGGAAPASLPGARAAASAIRARGARGVVATGLRLPELPGRQAVLAVTAAGVWLAHAPHRPVRVHGTGDAFAALLLGAYLPGRDLPGALGHAVAALDAVLAVAESTGADELPLIATQEALVHPPVRHPVERLG
jgi:pyridoxine kinase